MKKRLFAVLTASFLVLGVAGIITSPNNGVPTMQRELPPDY